MERKVLNNLSSNFCGNENEIYSAAERVVKLLVEQNKKITTAESCTGGMLGAAITAIPGSSACYNEGIITYSNETKMKYLGVGADTLEKFGAVSSKTASEMANGAMNNAESDISVAITGIAGPGGDGREKCVGLVYICVKNGDNYRVEKHFFDGDRSMVRRKSVMCALCLVEKTLNFFAKKC